MSSLSDADVRALLADAAERASCYLGGIDTRAVAPGDAVLAGLAGYGAGSERLAAGDVAGRRPPA